MHAVRLVKRPNGLPDPDQDFALQREPQPTPADVPPGHVLVRLRYLSMDPAMRGWMSSSENSYLPPVELGAVMRGAAVGQVLFSRSPDFAEGDFVNALGAAWCQYAVFPSQALVRINPSPGVPLRAWAGLLGGSGLTAFFGLADVACLAPGETVVVSAAAGAVGSAAAQLAKHVFGCRVVGIAGGRDKCEFLVRDLGLDAAVDYRSPTFAKDLRAALPKAGMDVFFDNVGGKVLDTALRCLALDARVVLCGAVSQMNGNQEPIANLMNLVVKSARMEGFVLIRYRHRYAEALARLCEWVAQGKLKLVDEVVPGLDRAPRAMLRLFGCGPATRGKLVVDMFPNEPEWVVAPLSGGGKL